MTLRVFFPDPPDEEELVDLRAYLDGNVEVISGPELPSPANYHILVSGRLQQEHIAASPHLRAIIVPFAGVRENTRELLRDFPQVSVHNLHHHAPTVAEFAFALLLAAAKLLMPHDRDFRNGDWSGRYEQPQTVLLRGKTVLILGYGSIGQYIARLCQGFGMRLLATRRNPQGSPPNDLPVEIHPPDAMRELLPRADVLMIALPLTPETKGLLGAAELALLPRHAILVNVGRGPIVDEEALFNALSDGRLHSAGLDVWYNYPKDEASRRDTPPANYPFHTLDNVVMSPHRAGDAPESEKERMSAIARLINAAARGEAIPNRVDLEVGY